jgi:hypothetical protein
MGIPPHGSGSERGPAKYDLIALTTKMTWPAPRMNAPMDASQFRVHRDTG